MKVKSLVFSGALIMRVLRIVIAGFMAYQAVVMHSYLAGGIAAMFLFQAVTNTGCCGLSGCSLPSSGVKDSEKEITFEKLDADKK